MIRSKAQKPPPDGRRLRRPVTERIKWGVRDVGEARKRNRSGTALGNQKKGLETRKGAR